MAKQDNTNKKLDSLINAVEKLVANPVAAVAPVLPVLPIAPVAPIAPLIINQDDHNLLIKLDGKVDALKDDIRSLNDGTTTKINDHEVRIKTLESTTTKLWAYGTALVFAVGLAEFLLSRFWK
jgi:hypothetical protein